MAGCPSLAGTGSQPPMHRSNQLPRATMGVFPLLAAFLLLGGCSGEPPGQSSGGTAGGDASGGATLTLTGAGATFPYPLYSKWFDAYHAQHPDVRINYQPIGSGGGIQQLKQGTVDFGASDAPLSDTE